MQGRLGELIGAFAGSGLDRGPSPRGASDAVLAALPTRKFVAAQTVSANLVSGAAEAAGDGTDDKTTSGTRASLVVVFAQQRCDDGAVHTV